MTKQEKFRILIRFLKEEKCYLSYLFNFKEQSKNLDIIYQRSSHIELDSFIEHITLRSLITRAFIWNKTPQGYDYWHEMSNKLVDIAERINKKLP